jgi:alpha-glucosidase (family GH31 glycosyl hydrolase)
MRNFAVPLLVLPLIAACGSSTAPGAGNLESGQGAWTIDAGALKLSVQDSPWRMSFHDAAGQRILIEHSGTGITPTGSLGMHLGLPPEGSGLLPLLPPVVAGIPAAPLLRSIGWAHATALLEARYEGQVWVATVATTDPLRTLEVRAVPEGDGIIAFTVRPSLALGVQALGIGFQSAADERFFGFGERGNAVAQQGNTLEHYVGEGPYQDIEYPFVTVLVPKWGIRWRRDATYFPMPWLLSSRGYGVLLDNDELSYHRLHESSATAWSAEVESTELRFRVFAGPKPADVLQRFSAAVGRQPGSPAPWFFGPWVQPDTDARIEELRLADVPTSLTATYTHYLPCGVQQGNEQGEIDRVAFLRSQGTAVHTYFNPMICTDYQPAFGEAEGQGALIRNLLGLTYIYPYTGSTIFFVSQFDFSAPNGIAAYRMLTDEAIAHGYEGWMEDFGEYTPLDAVAADGSTGTRFHNRYARDYHCGVQAATAHIVEAGKPLARFVRSGWTGSAACSPIVWGGDPTTGFGFDGLESSIYQALSIGTSGVGIWGSDIGGFFALGFTALNDELLDRWTAFGALSVVMRSQKDGFALPDRTRPQLWDAAHLPVWRRYAKLHTQLYPYIRAAADEYYATGMPIMRHHALTHPDDPQAIARDDQYMFGPDILVAPVYIEGAAQRELYLPAGKWIEWWRAVSYNQSDGSFKLTNPVVIEGGRSITVDAPLDEIPLFVRAGAAIPMLPADVYTLAEHGDDPDIVHLSDREGQVSVLEFPQVGR